MPGPILHVGAGVMCPHGGARAGRPGQPRACSSAGMPVATMADTFPVAGCPFQVPVGTGTKPQPCVRVQWLGAGARVQVNGAPVILPTSAGLGVSAEQHPAGPADVSAVHSCRRG